MALCLEGSVIFTPHRKNQCGNLVNITNVLIWVYLISGNRAWRKLNGIPFHHIVVPEVADMNATSEDQLTEKEDTNPDEHKCSLFGCRPRWLQFFAKPYWLLLVLNLFIVFEGAIVSGMDVVAKQGVCVYVCLSVWSERMVGGN